MHRVIIPVDFSDTALNAARFVALMLSGKKDTLAILYHNYKDSQDANATLLMPENMASEGMINTGTRLLSTIFRVLLPISF